MRASCSYLLSAIGALLLALSCQSCRGPRLIPEARMSAVYADMFMADQWIRENSMVKRTADTTLFYEPIFEKYGYSFEDYDYSLNYYLDHPDKFIKILTASSDYLKGKQVETQESVREFERIRKANSIFRGYENVDFTADSLRWADSLVLWSPAAADSVALSPKDTTIVEEKANSMQESSETECHVERRNSIRPDPEQEVGKLSGD